MKKVFSVLAAVLLSGMMGVTAFAHGGHGNGHKSNPQPRHAVCAVEGCQEAGAHEHNGTWYCGQAGNQSDYPVCTVENCTTLGLHAHNGDYYYCQNHGSGSGCGRNAAR